MSLRHAPNWHVFTLSYLLDGLLGNKGISLFNLKYSSPELSKQSRYNRKGEKKRFGIRYQKGDISRIAIFDGDRYLCDAYASELRLSDGSYRHLSLAELDIAKANANANANSLNSSTAARLLQHLGELESTAETRKTEKKQRQKPPKHSLTANEIPTHLNSDGLRENDREDSSLLAAFGRVPKKINPQ